MNQNQVELIAIDMDGTLLDSQKEIPVENIQAIQEAAAAGIKIVLCTGRPRSGIVPHFEKLGLSEEEYIIMNNGCSTYETKNWTLLQHESLSHTEFPFTIVMEFIFQVIPFSLMFSIPWGFLTAV